MVHCFKQVPFVCKSIEALELNNNCNIHDMISLSKSSITILFKLQCIRGFESKYRRQRYGARGGGGGAPFYFLSMSHLRPTNTFYLHIYLFILLVWGFEYIIIMTVHSNMTNFYLLLLLRPVPLEIPLPPPPWVKSQRRNLSHIDQFSSHSLSCHSHGTLYPGYRQHCRWRPSWMANLLRSARPGGRGSERGRRPSKEGDRRVGEEKRRIRGI